MTLKEEKGQAGGQEAHTSWRAQTEEQIKTTKERKKARGTHKLGGTEERTSQDSRRK